MNYRPEATGIGPYTAGLAEHLARRGYEVVVGTTFPHYPHWKWQTPMARWRRTERLKEVSVRRVRVILPRRPGAGWRITYDSSFAGATLLNNAFVSRPDLVLCVSPPIQVAFTGAFFARRWRVPLVLLLKDLPLQAALSVGMMRPGVAYRVGEWLEKAAYALADRIVVINERFRHSLTEHGVPPDKVTAIPDWADIEEIHPRRPEPEIRKLLGASNGEFIVLHSGNIGEKQGLITAVRAAQIAGHAGAIRLALVGEGSQRHHLEQIVASEGITSVTLLPLQSASIYPRVLGAADLLLINQRANVLDSVVPSKLLSYMAAARPILAAVHTDSVAAHVVREAGCGVVVGPEDPDVLSHAMRDLSTDADGCRRLGVAGRQFVEKHFEKEAILSRWEALLLDICRPGLPHPKAHSPAEV